MPEQHTISRPPIERTCEQCGGIFYVYPTRVRQGKAKYCSLVCYRAMKASRIVEVVCTACGKTFTRYAAEMHGQVPYCSRTCQHAHMKQPKGSDDSQWRGGRRLRKDGYIHANDGGRDILEHRLVMERHLGRPLRTDEHVHHVNGVKADNRIENLQLMTAGEHMSLHLQGNTRNRVSGWSRHYECCIECGTTTIRHAAHGRCRTCNSRGKPSGHR